MPEEPKAKLRMEIAHVLFIDIVGYSTRPTDEQQALVDRLNQVVRSSDEFNKAAAMGRLMKIPTGDGMALIFYNSPEQPVECAVEISRVLRHHPDLPVRMGVHSGPVSAVTDVNDRVNAAGVGINLAQRLMDSGDAGHILLSKRVAEDLQQNGRWRPYLHDRGEIEVKHGETASPASGGAISRKSRGPGRAALHLRVAVREYQRRRRAGVFQRWN
jgi:class 3 adenylate cyclase